MNSAKLFVKVKSLTSPSPKSSKASLTLKKGTKIEHLKVSYIKLLTGQVKFTPDTTKKLNHIL